MNSTTAVILGMFGLAIAKTVKKTPNEINAEVVVAKAAASHQIAKAANTKAKAETIKVLKDKTDTPELTYIGTPKAKPKPKSTQSTISKQFTSKTPTKTQIQELEKGLLAAGILPKNAKGATQTKGSTPERANPFMNKKYGKSASKKNTNRMRLMF
ncbi:hypothetical protein [Candidatus Lokiarchaeum ossiferum]|uniref:hypothetical protein n=1 Tax=Candidatus Lokiarchaeum ossiferum TaxID=2951803 RepID=UPI00352E01E5